MKIQCRSFWSMLRSGRLVILLCSSMNNISLASLPRQIIWIVFFIICDIFLWISWFVINDELSAHLSHWLTAKPPSTITPNHFISTFLKHFEWSFLMYFLFDFDDAATKMKPAMNHIFKSELKNLKCHVRKWTCLRLKISNIFGATALSEKRIHRQRRKELKNWEL